MKNYLDVLSLLIMFSGFILMASKTIRSYIKAFKLQSMLIGITAGIIGIKSLYTEGHIDILIVCIIIIALKVIYIPNLLHKTYSNVEYKVEKDFFLNIPILVIICCILVIFSHFTLSSIEDIKTSGINLQIVNSISLVLIGIFFMISRKKAIGQIVGFLMVENGLFVTAMFSTHGMPFIVDIGIFIDLITAILIMGIMVFKINEKFDSIDINKLKNLRG